MCKFLGIYDSAEDAIVSILNNPMEASIQLRGGCDNSEPRRGVPIVATGANPWTGNSLNMNNGPEGVAQRRASSPA